MFGEEDNIMGGRVDDAMSDMFSDDYFYYGDWKEAGMLDMLIIETNARLLQYY